MTMDLPKLATPEKIRLIEINSHLTCFLCKGYFIDATTISECLHSFCRSCLIKFLQENSHCPKCEVLINKAKPNIKLDKTLQDIVYKLVPELFLNEMLRRQRFYQKHPEAAAKATPEDRGEDTERTIFSPRDSISLSIEYIREDSTPGAIAIPPSNCKNGTEGTKNGTDLESLALRRYLQCPGMCRVEVLKKFICSKYNVDINKFYIEILYKRVPLPDHYTLIDIAYIYSWKRNEPMKFFFKIIDIDTNADVSEDVETSSFPKKISKPPKSKRKTLDKIKATDDNKKVNCDSDNEKCDNKIDKNDNNSTILPKTIITSNDNNSIIESSQKLDEKSANKIEDDLKLESKLKDKIVEIDLRCSEKIAAVDETKTKSDKRTEEAGKIVRNVEDDLKKIDSQKLSKEYTKITLNRNSNMEIITKVQQVSNKDGQPIGLKITKQLVKKPVIENNKILNKKLTEPIKKISPKHIISTHNEKKSMVDIVEDKAETNSPISEIKNATLPEPMEVDPEKSKFLESFELTAKSSLFPSPQKQNNKTTPDLLLKDLDIQKNLFGASSSSQKRKTFSPMKNERASKKQKSLAGKTSPNKRKPEPKNIANPTVRQMVSNVHQSATNVSKIVEQSSPKSKCNKTDLQSLFDSCKINIPSSLSITIKEGTEDKNLPPVKPVKNYIEILKLPDTEQKLLKDSKELNDEYRERPKLNITVTSSASIPNGVKSVPKDETEELNKLPKSSEETTSTTTSKGSQNSKPLTTTTVVASTYVPEKVTTAVPIQLAPLIANQSFQKMFEESIKKSNWCISNGDNSDKDEKPPKEDNKNKTTEEANVNHKKETQKIALDLTTDSSNSSSNSSSNGLTTNTNTNKKNILEIATQLYKKSKLEQTKSAQDKTATTNSTTSTPSRHIPATPTPNYTPSSVPLRLTQTLSNLHSASLGLNYTVSVTQNNSPKLSPKISVPSPKRNGDTSKVPTTTSSTDTKVKTTSPKIGSSPKPPFSLSPKPCANSSDKGVKTTIAAGSATGGLFTSGGFCIVSSKGDEPAAKVPRVTTTSSSSSSKSDSNTKTSSVSPKVKDNSQKQSSSKNEGAAPPMNPNEILEKYNIQNLAQLTANFNFPINFAMLPHNQLAALHQAMILRHFELQNRQNWLNMNPSPLVQYEKYLQSLSQKQGQILSKEN